MSQPNAYVHVELKGKIYFVGRLWVHAQGATQRASFEYDKGWTNASNHFALEPALKVGPGPYHTATGRALFSALGDSAPDRWGRTLLARKERIEAREQNRTPRALLEIDYLLGLSDFTRQGALRFSIELGGPFLAQGQEQVPPFIDLGLLQRAAERVTTSEESSEDLHLLLAPGSSLLGSRPKASVRGKKDLLLMAKFNRPDDDYDVGRWEGVAMSLAKAAGINVATFAVESINQSTVLLMQRFDREGTTRIPFLSAMSMLEAVDGENRSYLEIADVLRVHSSAASKDLRELWRRIVFSVLISNTDDHLRNHGFLYAGNQGWRLSPAYDLNPVPTDIKPRFLSTSIGEGEDRSASVDLAFAVAAHFGINAVESRKIAKETAKAVSKWRSVAKKLGATTTECDRMASAFEHQDLALAL